MKDVDMEKHNYFNRKTLYLPESYPSCLISLVKASLKAVSVIELAMKACGSSVLGTIAR